MIKMYHVSGETQAADTNERGNKNFYAAGVDMPGLLGKRA
jgi:hypothetical protein